mgnify:CR=1 FL=1
MRSLRYWLALLVGMLAASCLAKRESRDLVVRGAWIAVDGDPIVTAFFADQLMMGVRLPTDEEGCEVDPVRGLLRWRGRCADVSQFNRMVLGLDASSLTDVDRLMKSYVARIVCPGVDMEVLSQEISRCVTVVHPGAREPGLPPDNGSMFAVSHGADREVLHVEGCLLFMGDIDSWLRYRFEGGFLY